MSAASERQELAYQLRMAGSTYAEIAATKDPKTGKRLYANAAGAHKAVKAVRERRGATVDPQVRGALVDQEIERIDRLQRALWSRAVQGDVDAVREVRQLILLRARLQGVVDGKGAESEKPEQGSVIDDLAARRARRRAGTAD